MLTRWRGKEVDLHPNNLPLSNRRHVPEWDTLGLEPMAEADAVLLTSGEDSGGA